MAYPIDRNNAARCLAKAIAYVACGKIEEATVWLRQLLDIFRDAGVEV